MHSSVFLRAGVCCHKDSGPFLMIYFCYQVVCTIFCLKRFDEIHVKIPKLKICNVYYHRRIFGSVVRQPQNLILLSINWKRSRFPSGNQSPTGSSVVWVKQRGMKNSCRGLQIEIHGKHITIKIPKKSDVLKLIILRRFWWFSRCFHRNWIHWHFVKENWYIQNAH